MVIRTCSLVTHSISNGEHTAFVQWPCGKRTRMRRSSNHNLNKRISTDLLHLYSNMNPMFKYSPRCNPRRVLTRPCEPKYNHGYDNDQYDLIVAVNDVLHAEQEMPLRQFKVVDLIGCGTFGLVVKCYDSRRRCHVALKIIKNRPAYYNAAFMEIRILRLLNDQYDPADRDHIVRLWDHFIFRNHLCLAFEVLSHTLYDVIRMSSFQGLSHTVIRSTMRQVLETCRLLRESHIIHCDLKPENILLCRPDRTKLKVIDFGSACFEFHTLHSYIQSRFYRSPEVLIGITLKSAIDIWSLGCIAAELFLGLPLFPGTDEYDQIFKITAMLGPLPMHMVAAGNASSKFYSPDLFLKIPDEYYADHGEGGSNSAGSEPSRTNRSRSASGSQSEITLEQRILQHRVNQKDDDEAERYAFVDFLRGLLELDPAHRWTPSQALGHPYLTGESFDCAYQPEVCVSQATPPLSSSVPYRSAPQTMSRTAQLRPVYTYSGHRQGGACAVGSANISGSHHHSVTTGVTAGRYHPQMCSTATGSRPPQDAACGYRYPQESYDSTWTTPLSGLCRPPPHTASSVSTFFSTSDWSTVVSRTRGHTIDSASRELSVKPPVDYAQMYRRRVPSRRSSLDEPLPPTPTRRNVPMRRRQPQGGQPFVQLSLPANIGRQQQQAVVADIAPIGVPGDSWEDPFFTVPTDENTSPYIANYMVPRSSTSTDQCASTPTGFSTIQRDRSRSGR